MKSHIIRKAKLCRPVDHDISKNMAINMNNFWGLVAVEPTFLFERHVVAIIRVLKFHYRRKKRRGSFMINLKMSSFLTKKAIGVRMGKGKGAPDEKVLFLRPGSFILCLNDLNTIRASYVIKKCQKRLPISTYVINNNV